VSHGGKMIATSESNGERLWTRNIASMQMPWVAGDTVYVVDLSGKLWALSRTDGAVKWASDLPPGGRWSGPVLAGGRLWLVSGDGLLVAADARSGQVLCGVVNRRRKLALSLRYNKKEFPRVATGSTGARAAPT
jgi:outer membrane protein assembly factor BamB